MTEGYSLLSVLIFIIIAFGVTLSVYIFRGQRAISKAIELFYQHNALGIKDAKTLQELGLEKPNFSQRIMRGRDYKQYALQILIKRGVVYVTEDRRLYMVEDKSISSALTPRTWAFRLSNFKRSSWKARISFVQPGVKSLI